MKRLTQLLRENQIGEWCKRAAWLIAVFNTLQMVVFFWGKYGDYTYSRPSIFSSAADTASTIQEVLAYLTNTIFLFFLLYAAGGVANHFLGTAQDNTPEEAEEEEPA